jgi:hypothetical protein
MMRLYALRLIAGCPNGVTTDALAANGVNPETLRDLRRIGLVRITTGLITTPGQATKVTRYHITDKGRWSLTFLYNFRIL